MNEKATQIATGIVLAGFGLIVMGSVSVPAVMAAVIDWRCILVYPVALVLIVVAATIHNRHK